MTDVSRVSSWWVDRPVGPVAYNCAKVTVVRDGSAIVFSAFGQQPVKVGDVILLAARSYPPHRRAGLHRAVEDDLLPENTGRFVLCVADGRGTVERGGAGMFMLGIRALASLYSGFLTPHDLAMLGELAATEADLTLAAAIFGGPAPWLVDMF